MIYHDIIFMMKAKKFATQIDEVVLEELRKFAAETDKKISTVVNDAVLEVLKKNRVRPAFRSAMKEVIEDNKELLARLAK